MWLSGSPLSSPARSDSSKVMFSSNTLRSCGVALAFVGASPDEYSSVSEMASCKSVATMLRYTIHRSRHHAALALDARAAVCAAHLGSSNVTLKITRSFSTMR